MKKLNKKTRKTIATLIYWWLFTIITTIAISLDVAILEIPATIFAVLMWVIFLIPVNVVVIIFLIKMFKSRKEAIKMIAKDVKTWVQY